MMLNLLLLCAIHLNGVVGDDLRARAFFDANNVHVGDPLTLTIDFVGSADFKALHPPALAHAVDRTLWKVDDISAQTDTYDDARRLTYRVRPLRAGVIWFPALEFRHAAPNGQTRLVRANAIPVHAKAGENVVVAGMDEFVENGMPRPPSLITTAPKGLTDDQLFAWRKACATPTADAFAAFDFAEARLNEARMAMLEGNWARALKIYSRVEWTLGQTPDIERGIVAALAAKVGNPSVELPVWRQVGRPLLRYGWQGRAAWVLGTLAALAFVFWLLGRGIRAIACVALALLVAPLAQGQDIFQQMEAQMRQMQQRMRQMTSGGGGFSFSFGQEEEEQAPVEFRAEMKPERTDLQVGDHFAFILALEMPRNVSIDPISIVPSETFGLKFAGRSEMLPDAASANVSNTIKRIRVPVRYDVPFKGRLSFTLKIPYTRRIESRRRGFSFSSMMRRDAEVQTVPIDLEIKPLSDVGKPADYAGIVAEGVMLNELPDILRVETNDVIKITYRLIVRSGYVPKNYLPPDVAFEWGRRTDEASGVMTIEYMRYFIADGASETPHISIPYYDPRKKAYARIDIGGTPLRYVSPQAQPKGK